MKRAFSLLLSFAFFAGCSTDEPADTTPPPTQPPPNNQLPPEVSYFEHVRPLLADKCGGCHLKDGIAPFHFEDYEVTKPLAGLIANAVETKRMPPWGAHDSADCSVSRPFKGDIRLSDTEIALLTKWAADGAPAGEAPASLDAFQGELSALPRVDQMMLPAEGFSTSGTQDQFRCFILDPGFDRRTYLRGTRLVPGNDKVVHHAIVYADPSGTAIDELDEGNGQYDCFGGPGFDNATLVAAWAPGGIPMVFPDGAAMPIEAGTKFALQIHYHPIGPEPEEDRTGVELMYDTREPEYLAAAAFVGNFSEGIGDDEGLLDGPNDTDGPQFLIPAGMKGHTETMRLRIPYVVNNEPFDGAYLHAIASHMHYVGTNMTIKLRRGSQDGACGTTELDPLMSCINTACPMAEGFQLASCIEDSCGTETDELTNWCGQCLQNQFLDSDPNLFDTCRAPMPMPTDKYGDVASQPVEECLLNTPDWNFEWQRFYEYDAAIQDLPFMRAGDTFEFHCDYDNSMDNPFVREALMEQGLTEPRDVVLGDETLDEMCLIALTFLYKQ